MFRCLSLSLPLAQWGNHTRVPRGEDSRPRGAKGKPNGRPTAARAAPARALRKRAPLHYAEDDDDADDPRAPPQRAARDDEPADTDSEPVPEGRNRGAGASSRRKRAEPEGRAPAEGPAKKQRRGAGAAAKGVVNGKGKGRGGGRPRKAARAGEEEVGAAYEYYEDELAGGEYVVLGPRPPKNGAQKMLQRIRLRAGTPGPILKRRQAEALRPVFKKCEIERVPIAMPALVGAPIRRPRQFRSDLQDAEGEDAGKLEGIRGFTGAVMRRLRAEAANPREAMALQMQVMEALDRLPDATRASDLFTLGYDLGDAVHASNAKHGVEFYEPVAAAVKAWLWDVGPDAKLD